MSAEEISAGVVTLLAVLLAYVPGLSVKWYGVEPEARKLVYLALLVLVAGGAFAFACLGVGADLGLAMACDRAGAVGLLRSLWVAVVVGVGIEFGLPKGEKVREAANLARFK